jgi:hypothetical protein
MSVVAYAALLEHGRLVSMDLRKIVTQVAIETATFCDKTTTPIQTVALGALYARNRRMLMKRLKGRGRIRTDKEMHLLFAAFPQQDQRMQSRGRLQYGVKHIWEGLFGLDQYTVQLEFSRRCSRNQINLTAVIG